MLNRTFKLFNNAEEKAKEIMERKEEWEGRKLYGKTGCVGNKTQWFIGRIEKERR